MQQAFCVEKLEVVTDDDSHWIMEGSGARTTWSNLPSEMKAEIFSKLTRQEDIRQARLVCKEWRRVVDEHCELEVAVTANTDLKWISSLRLKSCTIMSLLQETDIFRHPSLLQRLRIEGPMNVSVFQRVIDGARKLQELSVNKEAFRQQNLIPHEVKPGGFQFITILELRGDSTGLWTDGLPQNVSRVFQLQLPLLEKLTLELRVARWTPGKDGVNQVENTGITLPLVRMLCGKTCLTFLHVEMLYLENGTDGRRVLDDELIAGNRQEADAIPEELLETVQLTSLSIFTVPEELPYWVPLMELQDELEDLSIKIDCGGDPLSLGIVEETLSPHVDVLTSVELTNVAPLEAVQPLDFAWLVPADNLKKLVLTKEVGLDPNQPSQPIQLMWLPKSVQELKIIGLTCSFTHLQEFFNRLDQLVRNDAELIRIQEELNRNQKELIKLGEDGIKRQEELEKELKFIKKGLMVYWSVAVPYLLIGVYNFLK